MNPANTRKLIGGFSLLWGLWWIWSIVLPKANDLLTNEVNIWDVVGLITIIPLITIPGIVAIVFGIRFFQKISEPYLKWVVALFSIYLVLHTQVRLITIFEGVTSEGMILAILTLPLSIIGFCLYLYLIRFLVNHLTQEERSLNSFVTRGALTVLAWILWFIIGQLLDKLIDEYAPLKEGYTHIHEAPWEMVSFFVPIVVAFVCYKVATFLLVKKQETEL